MGRPVIVGTLRTPFGKRGGALAGVHPAVLLGDLIRELLVRAGVHPSDVQQVVTGCSTQAGEQGFNVGRMAWLAAGLAVEVGGFTLDCQCGSSLQANALVASQIRAGDLSIALACGVESNSRVPLGSSTKGPGRVKPPEFPWALPHQFRAADQLAHRFGVTRRDCDEYGLRSQRLAGAAAPAPLAVRPELARDECPRSTDLARLAALPTLRAGGLHTAGTTSGIGDGAAAVLWMDDEQARARGLVPLAAPVAQVLVGSDPDLHIDGPIPATAAVLKAAGMRIGDVDLFEVNEAFSGVVLSWQRTFDVDLDRLNVRGGAIALGHPLGATGARLVVDVIAELHRRDLDTALVTLCCGSAVAPAMLFERC
jgi:acetyl-CoA C-acetyltransferase